MQPPGVGRLRLTRSQADLRWVPGALVPCLVTSAKPLHSQTLRFSSVGWGTAIPTSKGIVRTPGDARCLVRGEFSQQIINKCDVYAS